MARIPRTNSTADLDTTPPVGPHPEGPNIGPGSGPNWFQKDRYGVGWPCATYCCACVVPAVTLLFSSPHQCCLVDHAVGAQCTLTPPFWGEDHFTIPRGRGGARSNDRVGEAVLGILPLMTPLSLEVGSARSEEFSFTCEDETVRSLRAYMRRSVLPGTPKRNAYDEVCPRAWCSCDRCFLLRW